MSDSIEKVAQEIDDISFGDCEPHELRAIAARLRELASRPSANPVEGKAWEILTVARAIARRNGVGTAWRRFDATLAKLGVGHITARHYFLNEGEEQEQQFGHDEGGYFGRFIPTSNEADKRDADIARLVREKLTSGNGIPVERCIIKASEIAAIAPSKNVSWEGEG